MAKESKWTGRSYQPLDTRYYYFTDGLTPYIAKYYIKLTLNHSDCAHQGLFAKCYDKPITVTRYRDFTDRPIEQGDYCHVYGKNDRGFFRVINYRGRKVILEDDNRGGRFTANPTDLLVVTDQLKANIAYRAATNVVYQFNQDTSSTNTRTIKAVQK